MNMIGRGLDGSENVSSYIHANAKAMLHMTQVGYFEFMTINTFTKV